MKTEKRMGRSGFVFSIDATLSAFLLVMVLATTVLLSAQATGDPYEKLQVIRTGKDALVMLDRQGLLSSGNATIVETALNGTLPRGVGAHISVSTYYHANGTFNLLNMEEYGESIPEGKNVYGASRNFVGMRNGQVANYSTARMWIWQK
jgi:hypothetical protein